jgi:hypothetical protein
MNFLVHLLLEVTSDDEYLSFRLFKAFMRKDNWWQLYLMNTPKLFDLCKKLKRKIEKHHPYLFMHVFVFEKIDLEPLMASVFLTFFSNIVDEKVAVKVFDLFILCK